MAREIFYTFNASAPPADPTVNSTKYVAPLTYPVGGGYYKAIAREGGELSTVTSKSFERSPEDYIHYYPLTADFNDHAGSNNLNSTAAITSTGAVISAAGQMLNITTAITLPKFTISMYFTIAAGDTDGAIICTNNNSYGYALFREAALKSWAGGGTVNYPNIPMVVGVEYRLILTKDGNQCQWQLNDVQSTVTTLFDLPIGGFGGISGFAGYECIGKYRDIKVYDRILTQDEINLL